MSQSYFKDRYEYKRNAWIIGWRVNSKFRLGTQKIRILLFGIEKKPGTFYAFMKIKSKESFPLPFVKVQV